MFQATVNNTTYTIQHNTNNVLINNEPANWDIVPIGENKYSILRNNKNYTAELVGYNADEKLATFIINNTTYTVQVKDKIDLLLQQMGMSNAAQKKANDLKAPMPGLVLKLLVSEGDSVKKGDSLLILEAMKMENVLKASHDGTIIKIAVQEKQTIEKGGLLIQFA